MLARDLDWAVARATAGNPAMRYASVTGLVEDLRRFLAGRPLLAVPDQRGYRWGKFVRRNRSGLAVAGVVVLALLTGLGMSPALSTANATTYSLRLRSRSQR